MIKGLLLSFALGMAIAGTPARAVSYDFSVTTPVGSTNPFPTFRFQLPDSPTGVGDFGYGFTIGNVATTGTSQYGPVAYDADYSFYTGDGLKAGFDDGTAYHSYFSTQLFSGSTASPTFELGRFSLYDDPAGPVTATLVISAVGGPAAPAPEPATWAMMILGLGTVGFALRRQRRAGASMTDAASLGLARD